MMSEWLISFSDLILGIIWITCGIYWLKKSPNYLLCIAIIINFIGILFLFNGIFPQGG